MSMKFAKKFRLAELTEQRIDQCAVLFARQFKTHNPIWGGLVKSQEQIYKYVAQKIAECLEWQKELKDQGAIPKEVYYNVICLDQENKVASANIGYDVYHYKNRVSTIKLAQFDLLTDFDLKSKALVDPLDTVPGTAYYSMLGTVSEKYLGSQLIVSLHYELQKLLSDNGYKKMYTRLTNKRSIKLFIDYGSVVILRASLQIGKTQNPIAFVKMEVNPNSLQTKIQETQRLKAKL